jgi:hypothetical protein
LNVRLRELPSIKLAVMKIVDGLIGFLLGAVSHKSEAARPASISVPHDNALKCVYTGSSVRLHSYTGRLNAE